MVYICVFDYVWFGGLVHTHCVICDMKYVYSVV